MSKKLSSSKLLPDLGSRVQGPSEILVTIIVTLLDQCILSRCSYHIIVLIFTICLLSRLITLQHLSWFELLQVSFVLAVLARPLASLPVGHLALTSSIVFSAA